MRKGKETLGAKGLQAINAHCKEGAVACTEWTLHCPTLLPHHGLHGRRKEMTSTSLRAHLPAAQVKMAQANAAGMVQPNRKWGSVGPNQQ